MNAAVSIVLLAAVLGVIVFLLSRRLLFSRTV